MPTGLSLTDLECNRVLYRLDKAVNAYSQKELAILSGIPQPMISLTASGKRRPSLGFANKLAKALRTDLETLLGPSASFIPLTPEVNSKIYRAGVAACERSLRKGLLKGSSERAWQRLRDTIIDPPLKDVDEAVLYHIAKAIEASEAIEGEESASVVRRRKKEREEKESDSHC